MQLAAEIWNEFNYHYSIFNCLYWNYVTSWLPESDTQIVVCCKSIMNIISTTYTWEADLIIKPTTKKDDDRKFLMKYL